MRKIFAVVCVVLFLLSILLVLAIANEQSAIPDEYGCYEWSNLTPVNIKWVKAPQNPKVVYVTIYTPNERLSKCLETSIAGVVRAHGLKPVLVKNISSISRYDLMGRVVIGYFSVSTGSNIISKRVTVSGILYYSLAGDVKSALKYINASNTSALSESSNRVITLARNMRNATLNRLTSMGIINTSCTVCYWWKLKAETSVLSGKDPYKMVASAVARQLNLTLNENVTVVGVNSSQNSSNCWCYKKSQNASSHGSTYKG